MRAFGEHDGLAQRGKGGRLPENNRVGLRPFIVRDAPARSGKRLPTKNRPSLAKNRTSLFFQALFDPVLHGSGGRLGTFPRYSQLNVTYIRHI